MMILWSCFSMQGQTALYCSATSHHHNGVLMVIIVSRERALEEQTIFMAKNTPTLKCISAMF